MQITRRGADYWTPFQTMVIVFYESLNLLSFKYIRKVIINVNNEISVSFDIILEVSKFCQVGILQSSCIKMKLKYESWLLWGNNANKDIDFILDW